MPIRPQLFTARLADRVILNDAFQQLYFELVTPDRMEFQAGQYISLSLPNSPDRRSYSICSEPAKDHGFELLIDITPHGKGTTYLESLKFGDEISFLSPLGLFVVKDELVHLPNQPLIFVASGSGIAPYRSLLLDQLQKQQNKNKIVLHWGMRHEEDLFWLEDFEDLVESYPNFQFHPVISQAKSEWSLCRGRVTDCLTIHELTEFADYYLCGSTNMVTDVTGVLSQRGVPKEKIHFEKFF